MGMRSLEAAPNVAPKVLTVCPSWPLPVLLLLLTSATSFLVPCPVPVPAPFCLLPRPPAPLPSVQKLGHLMQQLAQVQTSDPDFRGIVFTDTKRGTRRIVQAIAKAPGLTAGTIRATEFVGHQKTQVDDDRMGMSTKQQQRVVDDFKLGDVAPGGQWAILGCCGSRGMPHGVVEGGGQWWRVSEGCAQGCVRDSPQGPTTANRQAPTTTNHCSILSL